MCSLLVCEAAGAPFWLLLDELQMSKRSILDFKKVKKKKLVQNQNKRKECFFSGLNTD